MNQPELYAELDRRQARIEGLEKALRAFSAAAQPIRQGERNGAAFGFLSLADDAARAALKGEKERT